MQGVPMKKLVVMGVPSFCVVMVVTILLGIGLTSGIVNVADEFFAALRQGDYEEAYGYLSEEFHGNTSIADLKAFAQESALAGYSEATWWNRQISGDEGALDGEIETAAGECIPTTIYFLKENDAWKIYQIDWDSFEQEAGETPDEVTAS
jgi:hypothetical protein